MSSDAKENLIALVIGVVFLAIMYWRSPAWRETIQELWPPPGFKRSKP